MTGQIGGRGRGGFTLIEVMVATVLLLVVMGVVLPLVDSAQASFQMQGEAADMHQRLRAATDLLATELRSAKAVRPYRVGDLLDDATAGVFYRGDTFAVLGVPESAASPDADATRTYYLKSDPATNTFALMQYDGKLTDLPVVEHVVRLSSEYVGATPVGGAPETILPAQLIDGPWLEDTSHRLYDADLLRVRQVRVRLRVESSDASLRAGVGALFMRAGTSNAKERLLPDEEIELHVALRNARRTP